MRQQQDIYSLVQKRRDQSQMRPNPTDQLRHSRELNAQLQKQFRENLRTEAQFKHDLWLQEQKQKITQNKKASDRESLQ